MMTFQIVDFIIHIQKKMKNKTWTACRNLIEHGNSLLKSFNIIKILCTP